MTTKEKALDRAILIAVTGSKAYGLDHPESDTDKMGVFVSPTLEVAGLDWNKYDESWTNTSPEGDDLTLHEVGKYLRLVLGGNPTLIELLFMNDYELRTVYGNLIIDNRSKLINRYVAYKAYVGYAAAQIARVENEYPNFKPKMARHALRITRQGTDLVRMGGFNVRVHNPDEYWDLTEMPFDDMMKTLRQELDVLRSYEPSPMDTDRSTAAEILHYIRDRSV